MPRTTTNGSHVFIDLSGVSLREVDELDDCLIKDILCDVLDPSQGDIAAAGFGSNLIETPEISAGPR